MKSKFLIALVCSVITSYSQNVNISNTSFFEGEPYLAINPTNPKNLVVAWMGFVFNSGTSLTIKVKSTFNGGQTWSNGINLPHIKSTYKSADVSMAFDATGKLHLTYIDYRQSPDSGGVYYTNSTNGGASFSTPVKVIDANADGNKIPLDRPWLTVNSSGTKLFVSTKPAPWVLPPNRAYLVASLNGGTTWNPWRYVDTSAYLIGALISGPMAFPNYVGNTLRILYPSYVASQNLLPQFLMAESTNNGGTFNYRTVVAANTSAAANDSAKSAYQLLSNPINTLNIVALFCGGFGTNDLDIFMVESTNGGVNWGAPYRVNDDTPNNGKMQDLMWGSFDASGNLSITWRDRRNAPGVGFARASEIFGTYRSAATTSFVPNFKISDNIVAYNNVLNQSGNDFMCNVLHNDTLHAVWGSTADGSLDIWYSKVKASNGIVSATELITSESFGITTFPNPTGSVLKVKLNNQSFIKELRVYDLQGKLILTKDASTNSADLNLSDLKTGIYVLNVLDNKGTVSRKKIIKN